jgi:hypothetical protein
MNSLPSKRSSVDQSLSPCGWPIRQVEPNGVVVCYSLSGLGYCTTPCTPMPSSATDEQNRGRCRARGLLVPIMTPGRIQPLMSLIDRICSLMPLLVISTSPWALFAFGGHWITDSHQQCLFVLITMNWAIAFSSLPPVLSGRIHMVHMVYIP